MAGRIVEEKEEKKETRYLPRRIYRFLALREPRLDFRGFKKLEDIEEKTIPKISSIILENINKTDEILEELIDTFLKFQELNLADLEIYVLGRMRTQPEDVKKIIHSLQLLKSKDLTTQPDVCIKLIYEPHLTDKVIEAFLLLKENKLDENRVVRRKIIHDTDNAASVINAILKVNTKYSKENPLYSILQNEALINPGNIDPLLELLDKLIEMKVEDKILRAAIRDPRIAEKIIYPEREDKITTNPSTFFSRTSTTPTDDSLIKTNRLSIQAEKNGVSVEHYLDYLTRNIEVVISSGYFNDASFATDAANSSFLDSKMSYLEILACSKNPEKYKGCIKALIDHSADLWREGENSFNCVDYSILMGNKDSFGNILKEINSALGERWEREVLKNLEVKIPRPG